MKAFIAVVRNRFGSLVGGSAKAVGVGATEPTVYNSEVLQAFFPRGKQEENVLATRELIQRQVGGTHMESIFVTKQNCNHGYPQAVVRRPVDIKNTSINSGMLRLTCPHLVQLIDEIEGEGGVKLYNESVVNQNEVQHNFAHVNAQWRLIKHAAITSEEKVYIEEKLQDKAEDFLNSGIIGIRKSGTRDVKCLHAHVADELIRDENMVGKHVLAEIVAAGKDPRGCDDCWQQCQKDIPREEAKWWYESIKNKSKLRKKRINRNMYPKTKKSSS